ncbi:penicillin-binding protein [Candidatus Saccharibacteria bacterium]|nr:penicillin-binding protein [Candidatus Saccharibacteria bacterium]
MEKKKGKTANKKAAKSTTGGFKSFSNKAKTAVSSGSSKIKTGAGGLKKAIFKKGGKDMNVYSSLSYRHKAKKEAKARKDAEELSRLPKNPVKRFFAKLHPKRVAKFVFSKRGLFFFLKTIAAVILLGIITIGGLFLYYKKDLESIHLDEMKVSESVNTYLDRNGNVLWEDKGDGDYRLVVDGENISRYMREATVAIEDRNFYNHKGIDFVGITRAAWSILTGQGVQGGSTLTQQLIKQVYFSDEAASANRGGLARKVKEMILAIEVEKMYSKEQIITFYLNESPYGGRRNGVESAAQAYFGKSAKDLTLAEASLLAAIPNNPAVLNPYNTYGNEALIARQRKTLDVMCEMGYITEQERDEAKAVNILDTIRPETGQYENIKAPHFVLEVKKQLEEKYGMKTMRAGGFTIKTTLDIRAQGMAEAAVAEGAKYTYMNKSDNLALSSVDVETGQVIAMVGSIDWNRDVYGELNAATSDLEPGSTIKPILDYGPLFMQRDGQNYGPGSILKDENIDKLYCGGYSGSCMLRNASNKFNGNITIRKSLGNSLNIPAVKALYINGIENSLEIAHKLGDVSYCANSENYGLAIGIGSGCTVKPIEHANAFASISRGGVYKPLAYVLEMKNSSGDIIEKWEDTEGERVYDAQVAYMLESILSDASARTITFGSQATSFGFNVNGVVTGSKTGTTTTSNANVTKDSWMASFSTAIATTVWNGNHDGSGLSSSSNYVVRKVVSAYMEPVHKELYASEGKWKSGDTWDKPSGIQNLTVNGQKDIWPSWYNSKTSGVTKETLVFNSVNKKKATACTPESLKESIEVSVMTDPVSESKIYSGLPDGYDEKADDDCAYVIPTVAISGYSGGKLVFGAVKGSAGLNSYIVYKKTGNEAEKQVKSGTVKEGTNTVEGIEASAGDTLRVMVTDVNGTSDSATYKVK